MTRPSIDHTLLSPSGRCSKRARDAALAREHARLFPPGYWDQPEPTPAEVETEIRQRLLRSAANLRALAARGMSTRRYLREAERMEKEAALAQGRGKP